MGRIARLKALIAATHRHGATLARALRRHPSRSGSRVLDGLRKLNAARRVELNRYQGQHGHMVSGNGVNFIKGFEGFRSAPYQDSVGVWTIGYGHTEGVSARSAHLTEQQASALLLHDLNHKYAPPINALGLTLTQNQFDALVSFVYNLGIGMLDPSHDIGRLLRQHKLRAAADSMLQYDHAGGKVLPGLKRRREAERALFLKP